MKILKYTSFITLIIGVLCIIIKAFTPEYVDSEGILHEYFFLLPIGFFFIFVSLILFIIIGIKKLLKK